MPGVALNIRFLAKRTIMKYENITKGIFMSRPNRFIANVEIDGKCQVCHVKNTGRCRELLFPGATVYVQRCSNPERKTKYDLIAVDKNGLLVNMDSQAPNKVFHEWVIKSGFFGNNIKVKSEFTYNKSRFDFYIEADAKKILVEVKGVTLEEQGIAAFPDAPTLRGLKHINELCDALKEGFETYVFFIIQMEGMRTFVPNRNTQPEFAEALMRAKKCGVNIKALTCNISTDTIKGDSFIKVNLDGGGYFG